MRPDWRRKDHGHSLGMWQREREGTVSVSVRVGGSWSPLPCAAHDSRVVYALTGLAPATFQVQAAGAPQAEAWARCLELHRSRPAHPLHLPPPPPTSPTT